MSETEFVWMSQDLDGATALIQVPRRAMGHYAARGFSEAEPPPRRQRPAAPEKPAAPAVKSKPSKTAEPGASGPAPSEGPN